MIGLPPSIYKEQGSPNTASFAFASASVQSASISDAAQTGLEISGGTMTLEFWVKHTTSAAQAAYMTRWSATLGRFCYYGLYNGFARIRFRIADSVGAQDYVEWTYVPTNAVWEHYAFVWDSALTLATGAMKFYLNGTNFVTGFNIITNNGINNIRDLNVPFTLGAFGDAASPLNGLMDEARVWNTARTQPEIAANMSIQIPGTTAGLQGYWQANNTPNDETPNANNLTLNNGAGYSVDVPFA